MALKQAQWLKPLVDFGPIAGFFISFKMFGLTAATAFLIILTLGVSIAAYILTKKVAITPLLTAIVVVIFGGLTLWLHNDVFIKMKPTIILGIFSAILFVGAAFQKPLLKHLMQSALTLDDQGWKVLSWRFAFFFAALAISNEIAWRTLSTDLWVDFKVFGILGLNFLFILTQMPLIQRHQQSAEKVPVKR